MCRQSLMVMVMSIHCCIPVDFFINGTSHLFQYVDTNLLLLHHSLLSRCLLFMIEHRCLFLSFGYLSNLPCDEFSRYKIWFQFGFSCTTISDVLRSSYIVYIKPCPRIVAPNFDFWNFFLQSGVMLVWNGFCSSKIQMDFSSRFDWPFSFSSPNPFPNVLFVYGGFLCCSEFW